MSSNPPAEFYYFAQAYFHQDFFHLYDDLEGVVADVAGGFDAYGSIAVLKQYLTGVALRLSDKELGHLWSTTNAELRFGDASELRKALQFIAERL